MREVNFVEYKFDGKKYVTKGIEETLPPDVQLFLFMCLNIMHDKTTGQLDYLQVFKLETTSEESRHSTEYAKRKMSLSIHTLSARSCS